MSTLGLMLTLFMTLVFTSCQVEETSGNGLVSGHRPATNQFSLNTPSSGTYLVSNTLNLSVTFPFDITINTGGGSPRLQLTVGSTTRYATYVAGSNPQVLNFKYTFVVGDNDTDGVTVEALQLNGSTLKFDQDGTLTDCDVSTITSTKFSHVKVDTSAPTVSAFQLLNPVALYNAGKTLTFKMTFSESVYVTGSPKFTVTFDSGGPHDVTYLAGSGSTILTFSYTITDSDQDTNGYNAITSPIVLGGGAIKDAAGNNASLDFSSHIATVISYSAGVDVVGTYPYVVEVNVPANGTYSSNQNLDFTFDFNRAVNLTGSPYVLLTFGTSPSTSTRQAQYLSGSGTTQLTFRYTTVPGDVDTDGIQVANTITQNSGNIRDAVTSVSYFNAAANNIFLVPDTSGVLLNAVQPQAISVTRNLDTSNASWGTATDNKWIIGQDLNITVGFNTNILVGQTGGTPYIPLTIGASPQQATYLSGGDGQTSLVFKYTIQEGDLDTDGSIAIGSIVLNGGTITDMSLTNATLTLPVASLSTTQIDGVRPTISSVTPPADGTYSTVTGNNQVNMQFTVNWSEAVNYSSSSLQINVDIGGSSTAFTYNNNNNSAAVNHRATNLTSKNDSDGVTISSPLTGAAVVKDQAGNTATDLTFTPPTTTGVLVDTTAPTVSSVIATTVDGTYSVGDYLDFFVTFSEPVTTNISGSFPSIPINIGGTTRYLLPTANATSTTHTFRYTIVTGDVDLDGVALSNTLTSSVTGYARDVGLNNVTGTFTPPVTTGILVDAQAPTVSSVSVTSNGTYEAGDSLSFTITYSENITVDTLGGTPAIQVSIGSNTRSLQYSSGTGTPNIVFTYTLTSSDFDADGLPSAISAISLNGGTMEDDIGNSAPTSFTSQNLSSIFVMFPNTKLWVQNDFVNKARTGSPTLSSPGVMTTETCGTGTCRTFSGDDILAVSSPLNGVDTVFMILKTPTVLGNFNIFSNDISLTDDGTFFDLNTTNSSIDLNGSPSSGVNHNVNMTTASTYILQVEFTASQNYNGTLIGNTFTGAIGEVIAVSGTLTPTQITTIQNYLQSKY